MEEKRPLLEPRITAALSLVFVMGSGIYIALSRPFSPFGLILFFAAAAILLFFCWNPIKNVSAAAAIIGVGAVIHALPPGVVISSITFGGGLMATGIVIAVLKLLRYR